MLRMPNINQVTISGRLVAAPDFRFTDTGEARLRARVEVNRSYRDRNQEWQEETSIFDIIIWHVQAEKLANRLAEGTPVFITGRLQSYAGRDAQDQPDQGVQLVVRNLQVLEPEEATP